MNTWNTIIVDDEQLARQRLKRLLSVFPRIQVIGEAENGAAGLELIRQLAPSLVFLDIDMPLMNGFELLAELDAQPRIVFTTAFDEYAIQAFEQNSIDYLLKPIEKERLEKTIMKLATLTPGSPDPLTKEVLREVQRKPETKTLTVKTGDRIFLLKISDIVMALADEKYVFIYTSDGKKYLTDYTIALLEEKLPPDFVRIHRSAIINSEQVLEIRKGFNGVFNFIMNGHSPAPVSSSRSYADTLKVRFDL
ncbi:MAG: response regulator [Chitinophagaceae bacterium]|nr:MAG: response regulator [Chitinophagaceae bacterium]